MLKVIRLKPGSAQNTAIAIDDYLFSIGNYLIQDNKSLSDAVFNIKQTGQTEVEITYCREDKLFVEQMSLSDKLGLSTAEIAQYEAPENVKVSWQKFQEDKQKESDSLSNKIKLYSIEHIHDQKIIYLQLVNGSSIKAKSSLSGLSDDIRQVTGGELSSIGSLIELARKGAISKMKSEAAKLGANAVFGVRISSSALDTKTAEASAYGTAAIIE